LVREIDFTLRVKVPEKTNRKKEKHAGRKNAHVGVFRGKRRGRAHPRRKKGRKEWSQERLSNDKRGRRERGSIPHRPKVVKRGPCHKMRRGKCCGE